MTCSCRWSSDSQVTGSDRAIEHQSEVRWIGLTLVKQLVEMHDGLVEAFSEGPGRGSEFIVRLPVVVEKPKVQSPRELADSEKTTTGRRILVVDDNRDSATTPGAVVEDDRQRAANRSRWP